MSSSIKSFMGFAAVRLLAQATLFIFPMLVALFISPEEFGRFSLALMVLYIFTAIGVQSSQGPFIVAASRELQGTGRVQSSFNARAVIVIGWFAVALIAAVAFKDEFIEFTGLTTNGYLYTTASIFTVSFRFTNVALFVSTQRKLWGPFFELIIGVSLFSFFLVFHWLYGATVETAMLTMMLGHGLAALLILPWIPWRLIRPFRVDLSAVRSLFRDSLWYVMGALAVYLINWGDNIVLRIYTDFESIGQYNFGYQIFKGMLICFSTIQMFYLPDIAKFLKDRVQFDHFLKVTRVQIMGMGVAGLVVVGLALEPGLSLVYGDKYSPALPVMYCLLIASVFALYQMLQLAIVVGMSRFAFVQVANFVALAVNLGLDFALVPHYGIMGAAIATTVAYAVLAVLFKWYVRNRLGLFPPAV